MRQVRHPNLPLAGMSPSGALSSHRETGAVRLTVADDGIGFDAEAVRPDAYGLVSMQERAARAGVALTFGTEPGAGTEVVASWSPPRAGTPAKRRVRQPSPAAHRPRLRAREPLQRRAVLGADVIPLAVERGWILQAEEPLLQQVLVAQHGWAAGPNE